MRGNSSPVIFNSAVPRTNLIGSEQTVMREPGRKVLPEVPSNYAAVYRGAPVISITLNFALAFFGGGNNIPALLLGTTSLVMPMTTPARVAKIVVER